MKLHEKLFIFLLIVFLLPALYLNHISKKNKIQNSPIEDIQKQDIKKQDNIQTEKQKNILKVNEENSINQNEKKPNKERYINANNSFYADLNKCVKYFPQEKYYASRYCFASLRKTYGNYDFFNKNLNLISYNEGIVELELENYNLAKEKLEFVLRNEQNDQKIIEGSQKALDFVNYKINESKEKEYAQKNDSGSYIKDVDKAYTWKNPKSIKVYIPDHEHRKAAVNAFRTWDGALDEKVNFEIVYSEQDANITLGFVEGFDNKKQGVTRCYNDGKNIIKANILISLNNPLTQAKNDDNALTNIILHEIGHSLGILGHSNNRNDIMYPTTDTFQDRSLSKRDINTVFKIYSEN